MGLSAAKPQETWGARENGVFSHPLRHLAQRKCASSVPPEPSDLPNVERGDLAGNLLDSEDDNWNCDPAGRVAFAHL